MLEHFFFKGVHSKDMRVFMTEKWRDSSPELKYDMTEIDGFDGALFEELSYLPISKSVQCNLLDASLESDVLAWLKGRGEFCLNDRYRVARIYDSIEMETIGAGSVLTFSIPFIFEPFWYKKDDWIECTDIVHNVGNFKSVPMIRLTGTGAGSVTVNGLTFGVEFDEDHQILIDCKEKTEDKPLCVSIGFEYPALDPGLNGVSFSGGVTKVEMMRKDRWMG